MPRLNILPSPTDDVALVRYDATAFPQFRQVFDVQSAPRLLHLALDPGEESIAIVLHNRSGKAITGLGYRWTTVYQSGNPRTQTCFNDSYLVDVYRPIAAPGSHHLVTPSSGMLDEALLDHVLAGGGLVACYVKSKSEPPPTADVVEMTFEIDLVVFEDGEICGPDHERHAAELQCRKPAAEFVVRQIRRAREQGHSLEPVLSALAEMPCVGALGRPQGDPLVHWTQRYARDYLQSINRKAGSTVNWAEAGLRHLENRPRLPKFYRRQQ